MNKCTCGTQNYGGGGICSSWCDSLTPIEPSSEPKKFFGLNLADVRPIGARLRRESQNIGLAEVYGKSSVAYSFPFVGNKSIIRWSEASDFSVSGDCISYLGVADYRYFSKTLSFSLEEMNQYSLDSIVRNHGLDRLRRETEHYAIRNIASAVVQRHHDTVVSAMAGAFKDV